MGGYTQRPREPIRPRIFYTGDVSVEHGGMFYKTDTFGQGYVDAVRVTPCSDAGGPGNTYWVERVTVNIPDSPQHAFKGKGDTIEARRAHRALHGLPVADRMERALESSGWDTRLDQWDKLTVAQWRHAIIEACLSYGCYDQVMSELVQIGKVQDPYHKHEGKFVPDKVLRANASLRVYAKAKL